MQILALDFDGVLCDSSREVFVVAVDTFAGFEPDSPLLEQLRTLRKNAVEGGSEYRNAPIYRRFRDLLPLGNRAEDFGVSLRAIDEGAEIDDQAAYDAFYRCMEKSWLDTFHRHFYECRDRLRETDLGGWLRLHLPYARPESSVTHTSWEKVGVQPDIETPAQNSLKTAYIEALNKLAENKTDEKLKNDLKWHLIKAKAQLNPVSMSDADMLKYTGTFGRYAILVKWGQLYWRYSDGTDYILIPITSDLFGFDDTEDIRLKMMRNDDGEINGFRLVFKDGTEGSVKSRTGEAPE